MNFYHSHPSEFSPTGHLHAVEFSRSYGTWYTICSAPKASVLGELGNLPHGHFIPISQLSNPDIPWVWCKKCDKKRNKIGKPKRTNDTRAMEIRLRKKGKIRRRAGPS